MDKLIKDLVSNFNGLSYVDVEDSGEGKLYGITMDYIDTLQMDEDKYNKWTDMLDSIDDQGKQAFNKILDEAKLKCGFSTNGKRIFVQLFPSKDGGCEMFITRLNNEHEKRYTIGRRKKTNCYIFNEFNNLLSFWSFFLPKYGDCCLDLYFF